MATARVAIHIAKCGRGAEDGSALVGIGGAGVACSIFGRRLLMEGHLGGIVRREVTIGEAASQRHCGGRHDEPMDVGLSGDFVSLTLGLSVMTAAARRMSVRTITSSFASLRKFVSELLAVGRLAGARRHRSTRRRNRATVC